MISDNKLKHSLGVARRCAELAEEYLLSEEEQKACFVMGFLHDIGYESVTDITKHPQKSAEYVDAFSNYCSLCTNAIQNHGKPAVNTSLFDIILNTADLTTDFEGKAVSVSDRLEGIRERHGENSPHYRHAVSIVDFYGII